MKVVQLRRLEEQLTAIEEMWAEEVIFGAKGIEILNDLRLLTAKVVAVFLLTLRNTTDAVIDLAPSTFAARVANERFEQAIANGPRTLGPGESAEAEFGIVGLPDGSRNDLSADNAFTILINSSRREPKIAAAIVEPLSTEDPQP